MQLRADQIEAQLGRGLKLLYTVYGDEPLLAQEAADAIRAAARAAGYIERKVFTVSGAHFDWSAVIAAAQSMSLFADRQLIEIRIPSGKPGKDGSEALQRYCEKLSDDVLTLVQLPRLDGQQTKSAWFSSLDAAGCSVRVDPVDRKALPAWIAQRLARQNQRVQAGEQGQHTLAFFADRVEGESSRVGDGASSARFGGAPSARVWRGEPASSSVRSASSTLSAISRYTGPGSGSVARVSACRTAARKSRRSAATSTALTSGRTIARWSSA